MKREQFYELFNFNKENAEKEGIKIYNNNKIIEVVKVKSVYNNNIKMYTDSFCRLPVQYQYNCIDIWRKSVDENLKNLGLSYDELLEKTKISKELIKRGYKILCEIEKISRYYGDLPEPHHWDIYAVFKIDNIQNDVLFYGIKYKRKVLIYTDDGVFEIKSPPYNLTNKGASYNLEMKFGESIFDFIGIKVNFDETIICNE